MSSNSNIEFNATRVELESMNINSLVYNYNEILNDLNSRALELKKINDHLLLLRQVICSKADVELDSDDEDIIGTKDNRSNDDSDINSDSDLEPTPKK